MGYSPSLADSDLWIRTSGDHHEYLAMYVDDILVFSHKPLAIIEELKKDYILKRVGEPVFYLGGDVQQLDESWQLDGIFVALSAHTYIENAVGKIEHMLEHSLHHYKSPMDSTYHLELDKLVLLNPMMALQYCTLGVAQHVGDFLTYKILIDDTEVIIF